jgi:hypothetical protein
MIIITAGCERPDKRNCQDHHTKEFIGPYKPGTKYITLKDLECCKTDQTGEEKDK